MTVVINDLVKKTGCSKTTISQALNNPYGNRVGKETRERISKIAGEMGYSPNPIARALRLKRIGMISLIIPDIANPVYAEIIRGVEQAIRKNKYDVVIYDCNRQIENELIYIGLSRSRRMDGIIIAATQDTKKYIDAIGDTPCVCLTGFKSDTKFDCVINNDMAGAYKAVTHFIKLGHQSIAALIRPIDYLLEYRRIDGYLKALKEHHIKVDDSLIKKVAGFDVPSGYQAAKELLDKGKNFTAIFAYNDILALGAMEAILEKGLRIPEDIALIGSDDIEFGKYAKVSLTTLAIQKSRMGQEAVELLMSRISADTHFKTPRKIVLEPELVIRDSCGGNSLVQGLNCRGVSTYKVKTQKS